MKETFLLRAKENLLATELLFEDGLYNASANRAYYAAFHAGIAAIYTAGVEPVIDHRTVQILFSEYFFNRRKILSSKFKGYLKDLQHIRNIADYKEGVSKNIAKQQYKNAKEFVEIIFKVI
jgi:uncharacterized protein (UPF0332 family)